MVDAVAAKQIAVKSKIVLKDMGNPKKIAAQPDSVQQITLGTLYGIATGIVRRTTPDTKVYEGLAGTFECVSTDDNTDTIQSSILYLPDGAFQLLADPLKKMVPVLDANGNPKMDADGEPVEKRDVESIKFAMDICVVRANNAAGYSWKFVPLGVQANDPLADLRATLATPEGRKQIASPDAAKHLAAPVGDATTLAPAKAKK